MPFSHIKKTLRPEDILALLLLLPSLYITSPNEYLYFFNGNLMISKHITAIIVLFLFSILTTLYQNRVQRIIDTIKSGVKIPAVTMDDQLRNLWKKRFYILNVFRDYIPFALCLLACARLSEFIPSITNKYLDEYFIISDKMIIENFRNSLSGFIVENRQVSSFLNIVYNTYALSVPILAIYLYLLKKYSKFREFMLAIVIASVFSILINLLIPTYGLAARGNGSTSLPACYTSIVLFFSLTVSVELTIWYIPLALLFFIADILNYSHYIIAILSGALIGIMSIPIAKLVTNTFGVNGVE